MKFYHIEKKQPRDGQWCLIREKQNYDAVIVLYPHPQQYFRDIGFQCHPGVVSWAPVPMNVTGNPLGWSSEFRGDELPDTDCNCLICLDGDDRYSLPRVAFYLAKKQTFYGIGERNVIAWRCV